MITLQNEAEIRHSTEAVCNWLRQQIQGLLPEALIEHIGSTAVPGALTRGDVDVQVAVHANRFRSCRERLDGHFDHNPGMEPTDRFVSYSGEYQGVDFGIQLIIDGETYFNFVKWRDALRSSPALLADYNRIKQGKASQSMVVYRQAKSDFIEMHLDNTGAKDI